MPWSLAFGEVSRLLEVGIRLGFGPNQRSWGAALPHTAGSSEGAAAQCGRRGRSSRGSRPSMSGAAAGPGATTLAATGMLQVRPGLYLGGAATAAEPGSLREAGVGAVLTVDAEEPDLHAPDLRQLFVPALDEPGTDLLSRLDRCVAFVLQARAEGRGVLVRW